MKSLLGSLINRAPVPYASDWGGSGGIFGLFSGKRGADKSSQLQAMGSVGTLFSIVTQTSTAVSSVDWHMHRKLTTGSGDSCPMCDEPDVAMVQDHQALRLLEHPNDFMTGPELFEAGQQHFDLTGETWLLVERVEGVSLPIGLWVIRPDRMEIATSKTDFIVGYVYTGPNGEKIPLELDDVIFFKKPDPDDPYRGLGAVQSIMRDIDSAKYSSEWSRNFFLNSAEPGGIIKTPGRLSDAEWRELSTRWREGHKGVSNSHRVAILEGYDWIPRTYSPKDIQFASLRETSRDVMLEAFGMPKFALGIIEDVNRATAVASMAWFAQTITVPRLNRWRSAFNHYFLPMFGSTGKGREFAYADPVPPDRESENQERQSKVDAFKTLVDAGVDAKEAAGYCGLPETIALNFEKPAPPPVPGSQPPPGQEQQPPQENRVVRPFVPSRRSS